jgi:methylglutaconyl-CoA hydratase
MTTQIDTVTLSVSTEGVAVVTLNRPAKKNAFSGQMIADLTEVFTTLKTQDHVRLVFLRGAGGTFSAGADLEWMKAATDYTEAENREDARDLARMLRALYTLPQATCAVVEGAAMGGGAGLIAACDLAVGTVDTKFCFSEARLGLIPAVISPYVTQAIGPRAARALFTTARVFDGSTALMIGLLTEAVNTAADLEAVIERISKDVLACAPGAVADCKTLIEAVWAAALDDSVIEDTARRIAARRVSDEGREGILAFLEKRKPNWTPE